MRFRVQVGMALLLKASAIGSLLHGLLERLSAARRQLLPL
jgi:hypothetical protein